MYFFDTLWCWKNCFAIFPTPQNSYYVARASTSSLDGGLEIAARFPNHQIAMVQPPAF
jgi:hypothetical protein